MTDFLQNEITAGAYIVYPGRSGSSLWVSMGKVIEVGTRPFYAGSTKMVPALKVLACVAGLGRQPVAKKVTLTNISAVTVVPAESVPVNLQELLSA